MIIEKIREAGRRQKAEGRNYCRYVPIVIICVTVCARTRQARAFAGDGCTLFIWADLGGPDVRVSIHYYYKFPNHCNIHVKIE